MKKIIILDFTNSKVFVFQYDENIYEDAEDFMAQDEIENLGIKFNNCQYMIVDELNITIY